jgi:hypothetical protein
MWSDLPNNQKNAYKRLILAFASLTDMFAQKSIEEDSKVAPIINSKYQETAFQKCFNAYAEDIGNTSYDASVQYNGEKYLVGIKTFGIASGDQKVAQFKAKHDEWTEINEKIKNNASKAESKEEINSLNQELYLKLASEIARIRNARIDSSCANIRGFNIDVNDTHVHSVYHVLMPSSKNENPMIYVGETSYDKINIDSIQIIGCTNKNKPTNFTFTDGNHVYKYTSADSQLHMSFNNREIVCEEWEVRYAEDAHAIFGKIADIAYPHEKEVSVASDETDYLGSAIEKNEREIEESYCWTIWNKNKEVEMYSGFNSFYGTGSKMGKDQRGQRIEKLYQEYEDHVRLDLLVEIKKGMQAYMQDPASSATEKAHKVREREYLTGLAKATGDNDLVKAVNKMLYRPMDEMYIPIPDSARFHREHPDFFGKGIGTFQESTSKLKLEKEQRRFNLVFEPSGDSLSAYITQDNGKAIESAEKQTYLGEWILRGIFQLGEYEPLTSKKLEELNINGMRFTKYKDSEDIHLEFIWIDEENPPIGFIERT